MYKENLQNSLSLIELKNIENLQEYANYVSKNTELRVTMIKEDGTLLAESHLDASSYEIAKAISDTTKEPKALDAEFLYVTKKASYRDDSIYIRLSLSLNAVMSQFHSLFLALFFIFLLIFSLAIYISKKMTQRVVYDVTQITNYMNEASRKNYGAVIKVAHFYEFLHMALIVKNLVKRLHSKDSKKQKNSKLS